MSTGDLIGFKRSLDRNIPYLTDDEMISLIRHEDELQHRLSAIKNGVFPWQNIVNLLEWKQLHDAWDYTKKGGFPHFDLDRILTTQLIMPLGRKPVVEWNFYLDHDNEDKAFAAQVKFMLEIVWPHVFKRYGVTVNIREHLNYSNGILCLSEGCTWHPGVTPVAMDLGGWNSEDQFSVGDVRTHIDDLLHVEILTHIGHSWSDTPSINGWSWYHYLQIPGIDVSMREVSEKYILAFDWDRDSREIMLRTQRESYYTQGWVIPRRIEM